MMNSFLRLWTSPLNTDFSPQRHRVSILLRDAGAIEDILHYIIYIIGQQTQHAASKCLADVHVCHHR